MTKIRVGKWRDDKKGPMQVVSGPINERQRKVLNLLFDGYEGNLTSTKWAKIGKCSQDTASRDIDDLVDRKILQKNPGGGRSTSYSLTA